MRQISLYSALLWSLMACSPSESPREQHDSPEPLFPCEAGASDWIRAQSFTPDAVPPCNAGSVGICKAGYQYIAGSGWCEPRR